MEEDNCPHSAGVLGFKSAPWDPPCSSRLQPSRQEHFAFPNSPCSPVWLEGGERLPSASPHGGRAAAGQPTGLWPTGKMLAKNHALFSCQDWGASMALPDSSNWNVLCCFQMTTAPLWGETPSWDGPQLRPCHPVVASLQIPWHRATTNQRHCRMALLNAAREREQPTALSSSPHCRLRG